MATQTGSIDLTASNSVKLAAEAGWQSDLDDYYTKAELDLTVQGINTEVSKKVNGTEIISTINQSAESVSINASKINLTGAVTISDLSSDAQSATLNSNISVGGRNLLRNTGNYATWDVPPASATFFTRYDDCIKFAPPETRNWWTLEPHEAYIPLSEWDTSASYTVSIDVKFDNLKSVTTYPTVALETVKNNTTVGYSARVQETTRSVVPTTNDWTHFEHTVDGDYSTWYMRDSGTPAYIKVVIWLHLTSGNADAVSFRNLKLERGNKATDWTPAPEDVQNELDNLSGYIRTIVPFNNAFDDTSKWYTVPNASTWTKLSDGWARCSYTNAGSSASSTYVMPMAEDIIDAYDGGEFTFLVEFRNVSFGTATPSGNFAYIQQIAGAQFWGNTVNSADGFKSTTYITYANVSSGSYTHRFVKPVDENSGTGAYAGLMFRYCFYLPANTTTTFDVRISIYPARYLGGYTESLAVAAADSIVDASKTATSYVTEITGQNGIMVHPSTDDDTGVQITSDVDILRNGYSVINVGTQGDTSGNTDAGVTIYDGTTNENVVATFDGDGIGLVGGAFRLTSERVTEEYGDENNPTTMTEIRSIMKSEGSNDDFETRCFLRSMVGEDDDAYYNSIELTSETDIETQSLTETNNASVEVGSDQWGSSVRLVADSQELHLHKHPVDGKDYFDLHSEVFLMADYHNGVNMWSTVPGTVLWSSGGWAMAADQTANLAYNVSTCPTGIVLHWQPYTSSTVRNYYHHWQFISKEQVASYAGTTANVMLSSSKFASVATKTLYVSDNRVTGHADNTATGTANGITYANNQWVLTQIIAV